MILTPFQIFCAIALILIVTTTITWLMFMHLQDRFTQRLNELNTQIRSITIADPITDQQTRDDVWTLWDAIVADANHHEGTDTR